MCIKITLYGDPRSKKNSQRIVLAGKRRAVIPSAQYSQYEKDCLKQIPPEARKRLNKPVNLRAVYYMATRRKVDLVNLLEATNDILVAGGALADDNCSVVASHDGSCVRYDKLNPRVEITIVEL